VKQKYKIEVLSRDFLIDNIKEFIFIASDIPKESWSLDNYIYELPGKWNLSLCIIDIETKVIAGFLIASDKGAFYHIHKYAVHPDFRSAGLGSMLLEYFEEAIRKEGRYNSIGLFVDCSNDNAIRFYIKNGFEYKYRTESMSFYKKILKW